MTIHRIIAGSRLDAAPHMSDISENDRKPGSCRLLGMIGFSHLGLHIELAILVGGGAIAASLEGTRDGEQAHPGGAQSSNTPLEVQELLGIQTLSPPATCDSCSRWGCDGLTNGGVMVGFCSTL